jgi:ketosteroid isomerase-like protein
MKILKLVLVLFVFCCLTFAQGKDLQKLVNTENAFAKYAENHTLDKAFIEFLAPDGIVFKPNATNGLEFYKTKPSSTETIAWQPTFADISANSAIGYTTGDWQYSTAKGETPTAFGQFVSIWQKQQSGEFKVVLDIGISHEKPSQTQSTWTFPNNPANKSTTSPTKFAAFIGTEGVYERSKFVSMYDNIYKKHFADDIRVLRDGMQANIGKKNSLTILKKEVSKQHFPKLKLTFGIQDVAYVFGTYDSPTDKGNFVHIWKFRNEKWQIVLDILSPVTN